MPKPGSGWHRKSANTAATAARKREYNSPEYKAAKQAGQRLVDAGRAYCWRPTCRTFLPPGKPWHLGHDDDDRRIIRGPECVPCNLGAASRKGAQVANARRNGRPRPRIVRRRHLLG